MMVVSATRRGLRASVNADLAHAGHPMIMMLWRNAKRGAACAVSVDPGLMETVSAELAAILEPACHRRDLRRNALLYLRGLLMPQVAGNCWPIAEAVGLGRPCRLRHLLERAVRDEDAAKDAVRSFLARHPGADGGVLIFDETGPVASR